MFVEFNCRCGHEFRTRSQNVGRPIICPNCSAHLVVPDLVLSPNRDECDDEDVTFKEPIKSASPEVDDWPIKGNPASPSGPNSLEIFEGLGSLSDDKIKSPRRHDSKNKSSRRSLRHKSRNKKTDSGAFQLVSDEEVFDDIPAVRRKKKTSKHKDSGSESQSAKPNGKKPKRDDNTNMPLFVGGIVAGLLLMGGIGFLVVPPLFAMVKSGSKVQAPQEFEKFEDNQIYFRCEVPKGWDVESRGGTGNIPPSVRIEHGRVKITYRSSLSGAAIQDMSQAGGNRFGEVPDELKPVARVHEYQREKTSQETPDYKEIGPPEKIETGWGEGRISTFTGSVGFTGKQYGYRVTLLTSQYQWNVICKCQTKREFEAFQPIFRRIIASSGR